MAVWMTADCMQPQMCEESDRLIVQMTAERGADCAAEPKDASTKHSGQRLPPTTTSDDLIGTMVPDRAFAWSPVAEHKQYAAIPMVKRLRQQPRLVFIASAVLIAMNLAWFGVALYLQENGDKQARGHEACLVNQVGWTVTQARAFLLQTANPSYTMVKQGPEFAINRLHPEFAVRLAKAINEARATGLFSTGVYSAYRPPAFEVGRFSDKFNSLHAYGLAVDMHGIGRPGSAEARLWHQVAARYGVICPYGPYHKTEWNHCQPTGLKKILSASPLRETITADGPVSLQAMFDAGDLLLEPVTTAENNQQAEPGILKAEASFTCLQSFAFAEVPALYGVVLGQFSFRENGPRRT